VGRVIQHGFDSVRVKITFEGQPGSARRRRNRLCRPHRRGSPSPGARYQRHPVPVPRACYIVLRCFATSRVNISSASPLSNVRTVYVYSMSDQICLDRRLASSFASGTCKRFGRRPRIKISFPHTHRETTGRRRARPSVPDSAPSCGASAQGMTAISLLTVDVEKGAFIRSPSNDSFSHLSRLCAGKHSAIRPNAASN
jgi:hypothetical protein